MQRHGHWYVLRQLGHGGMGVTSLAVHAATGLVKVLKVLHPEVAKHGEALARFRREAEVLDRLRSPLAVRHLESEMRDRPPWLVMEYVPSLAYGGYLAKHRAAGKAAPLARLLSIVRDVAEVLQAAHELYDTSSGEYLGVVHRDVSSANVLVSIDGTGRVIDFGMAAIGNATKVTKQAPAGTFWYLAPELRQDLTRASRQSDVFALGLLLYDGLTTFRYTPAFTERMQHLDQVLGMVKDPRRYYPLLAEARSDLSRDIVSLVDGAIASDAGARTPSMQVMVDQIDAAVARLGLGPLVDQRQHLAGEVQALAPDAVEAYRYARAVEQASRRVLQARIVAGDAAPVLSEADVAAVLSGVARPAVVAQPAARAAEVTEAVLRRPRAPQALVVDVVGPSRPVLPPLAEADAEPEELSMVVPSDLDEPTRSRVLDIPGWRPAEGALKPMGTVVLREPDASAAAARPSHSPSARQSWPTSAVVLVTMLATLVVVLGAERCGVVLGLRDPVARAEPAPDPAPAEPMRVDAVPGPEHAVTAPTPELELAPRGTAVRDEPQPRSAPAASRPGTSAESVRRGVDPGRPDRSAAACSASVEGRCLDAAGVVVLDRELELLRRRVERLPDEPRQRLARAADEVVLKVSPGGVARLAQEVAVAEAKLKLGAGDKHDDGP